MNNQLITKYNVPGPRYTSYPTVPFWKNNPLSHEEWTKSINDNYNYFASKDISLYIHLPFCESLCTFCGCHKRITKNHTVEEPYIDTVIKEWQLYLQLLPYKPAIKELHFGGGTPTFFRSSELIRLVRSIFNQNQIDSNNVELGFEAHPNNTTDEHLIDLHSFGFRRLSLGIQSYSKVVQKAINRFQPFEQVAYVHKKAKEIGYSSISHDLVYGLPFQLLTDMEDTIAKTLELRPDRISLYSYAHVPWIKGNGQRGYADEDLPSAYEKRSMYERSKILLENAGYIEIGMDHFALPSDALAIAFKNKTLHRNFMGYTTQNTPTLIGLGMSSISDSWFGFAQNNKSVEGYQEQINNGQLAVFRGHLLRNEELKIRQHILDLMCHFETRINDSSPIMEGIIERLSPLMLDGLVTIENDIVSIPLKGMPFVRNICMAFDLDLANQDSREKLFSKTI